MNFRGRGVGGSLTSQSELFVGVANRKGSHTVLLKQNRFSKHPLRSVTQIILWASLTLSLASLSPDLGVNVDVSLLEKEDQCEF